MSTCIQGRPVDELLDDLRACDRRVNALVADARYYAMQCDEATAAERCGRVIELLEGMRRLVETARAQLLGDTGVDA